MTEVLGEAVLDLTVDAQPAERAIDDFKVEVKKDLNEIEAELRGLNRSWAQTGASAQMSLSPVADVLQRTSGAAGELAAALDQVSGNTADFRNQLLFLPPELADVAAEFHDAAVAGEQFKLELGEVGREAVTSTALVVAALHEQEGAVNDLTDAYERLAATRALAAGAGGGSLRTAPGLAPGFVTGGPDRMQLPPGARGAGGRFMPRDQPGGFVMGGGGGRDGSPQHPFVMVIEAASFGGLDPSRAAAMGAASALMPGRQPAQLPMPREAQRQIAASSVPHPDRPPMAPPPPWQYHAFQGPSRGPLGPGEEQRRFAPADPAFAADLRSAADSLKAQAAAARAAEQDARMKTAPMNTQLFADINAARAAAADSASAADDAASAASDARDIAMLQSAIDRTPGIAPAVAPGGGGRGGGGGAPPVAVGGGDPTGGGGGGGGLGPFLATILTGHGGGGGGGGGRRGMRLPGWGGALLGGAMGVGAGFGSVGSFAGLGAEHLIMTALGIGGSAATAVGGAGLLGLGALGQTAVGGGADAAVMKSTIADTQALSKGYTTLSDAVAVYGKNSRQAAVAQAQLNNLINTLGGPKAVGVQAEQKLAQNAAALNKFWDQQTQQARVQAANILEQVVKLGHNYVPRVAEAARQNLSIINVGLKPLFDWLNGPTGVGIFNNLEKNFKSNLPTAVHAFDQGLELLLRTTSIASNYTGGFTKELNKLLTHLNSFSDSKINDWVGKLVGDFKVWERFVKALGTDLYLLFKQDASTGKAIIETLTGMLDKLGQWEKSSQGSHQLKTIFEVHKEEVLALLQLLPLLVSPLTHIYMTLAPALTMALTGVVSVIGHLLTDLEKLGPGMQWLVGLTLLGGKLFGFKTMFGAMGASLKTFGADAEIAAKGVNDLNTATNASTGAKAGGNSFSRGAQFTNSLSPGKTIAADLSSGEEKAAEQGLFTRIRGGLGTATAKGAEGVKAGLNGVLRGGTIALFGSSIANIVGDAVGGGVGHAIGQIGSDASIGAGLGSVFGPEGTIVGMFAGGLLGGVLSFIHDDAAKEGNDFANKFTASLPNKVKDATKKGVADATKDAIKQPTPRLPRRGEPTDPTGPNARLAAQEAYLKRLELSRSEITSTPASRRTSVQNQQLPVLDKEIAHQQAIFTKSWNETFNAAFQTAYKAGDKTAKAFMESFNQAKHPTGTILISDLQQTLRDVPKKIASDPVKKKAWQEAALQDILNYAASLQHSGKIAKGSVSELIKTISREFPALSAYLKQTNQDDGKVVSDAWKFNEARANLKTALADYRHQWGDMAVDAKITNQDWVRNTSTAMSDLRTVINTSVGRTHREAIAELRKLQSETNDTFTKMGDQVASKAATMHQAVKDGSALAYKDGSTNWNKFANSIGKAMQSGVVSSQKGAKLIADALNATLKAFGEKPLGLTTIANATPAQLAAVASGQVSSGALASRTAGGGLINIGRPGMPGRDSVPLNVSGTDIVVAPGEQLAVFNRHQAPVMNRALQREGYGGMSDFFAKNRKANHMAEGGMVPTGGQGYTTGGYVYPIPGFAVGRTDMGIDASSSPGSPIGAIGDSKMVNLVPNWYQGQPMMVFQLTDGPDAGRYWYVAEQIVPEVHKGQMVKAGHEVARYASSGTGIELGWAANASGLTLAKGTTGYSEGQITPAGQAFRAFLTGLAHGQIVGGGIGGPAPQIKAPKVKGTGTVSDIVRGAVGLETKGANAKLAKMFPAGGGGGAGLPSMGPGSVADNIYKYFTGQGWNRTAIAGLIGNWMQESSLDPAKPGGGLAQWIGDRWTSLAALAHAEGRSPNSLDVQLQFAEREFQGSYHPAFAAAQAASSPQAAAQAIEQMYEHAGTPAMSNRMNYAASAYAAGYDSGGIVALASGGMPFTTDTRGSGSTRPVRRGAKPGYSPSTTGHHGPPIPKNAKPKHTGASFHPPRLKGGGTRIQHPPKFFFGDYPKLNAEVTELNRVDDYLSNKLSPWAGYVSALHGDSVVPVITDPVTQEQTINWGDPTTHLSVPEHYTGLPDPSSGSKDPTKSIFDRLRELGYNGPSWAPQTPGKDVRLTPSKTLTGIPGGDMTELGLNYIFERGYEYEQPLAKRISKDYKPWLKKIKAIQKKDKKKLDEAIARIAYQEDRRARLPTLKRDRNTAITNLFAKKRTDMRKAMAGKTFNAQRWLTDTTMGLTKIRENDLGKLPASRPAGIINADAVSAWNQAKQEERTAIYDEYTTAVAKLRDDVAKQRLTNETSRLDQSNAISTMERNQKTELADRTDGQRISITDNLRDNLRPARSRALKQYNSDTKLINTAEGPPSWLDKFSPYLDPMGTLQINIDTEKNVTIPGLIKQATDLLGTTTTTPPPPAIDTSALDALYAQQAAGAQEEARVAEASLAVFTSLGNLLPPFGGSFALGGMVPGPLGEARTVIAHGGERITGPDDGSHVRVSVTDERVRVWHNDVEQIVQNTTRTAARHARRRLPGNAGGLT